MNKQYKNRSGSPFKEEKLKVYKERLDYIASNNGGEFTPDLVVKDGENKKSPFHSYFQWDDKKAGYEYRLQQARNLINHILEVTVIEGKQSAQRSFFNVTNAKGKKVYVTIKTAVSQQSYRLQLLNQLITTMENATELMKLFRSHEK